METSFMELCKAYDKAKPVILKEEPNGETPKFYIRILVEMEDLINKTWEDKDLRKNMNKNNSKSLGALRQKLRKYIRTDFEDSVAKFRENPDEGEEEEQEEEKEPESAGESDDEDAVPVAKVKVLHLLVCTWFRVRFVTVIGNWKKNTHLLLRPLLLDNYVKECSNFYLFIYSPVWNATN